jgi:hypothetical protein
MHDASEAGPTADPVADPPVTVVVAVLTYRRNDALAALLPLLVEQCRQLDTDGATASSVLIIDNDADRGAEPIVARVGPPARYVHEEVPGIAAGRARAVEEAAQADLLVFIDDDEVPSAGWLRGLWTAWLSFERPAGVVGRVTPTFYGTSDPWIDAGEFFVRPQRTTGSLVRAASSANLLLDLDVLRRRGLTFDRRLGLAGGEDTMLTRQLTEAGERLVWCHEAQVIDVIPASRMRRRWVLKRAFSHGAVESRVSLRLAAGNRIPLRARLLLDGAGRLISGAAMTAAGTVLRRLPWQARGARLVCRGAGLVVGATGRSVVEYSRDDEGGGPGSGGQVSSR